MLRSDFVMKLMSVILFVAVAAYIGLYIYHSANDTLKTVPAVRYTIDESGVTEGYIVRNEVVLGGENGIVTLMADEGEKLGSGQAVAVYYEGETALELASEICTLQIQINEARAAQSASSSLSATETEDCVLALSEAIQHKEFDELADLTYSVRNIVFTNSTGKLTEDELESLEIRLSNLLAQNTNTRTVFAPVSGIFTSAVDGYENLSSDALGELTPSSLRAMFNSGHNEAADALGKLITGITWYYAAVMDSSDAQELEGRETATLQFTKTYFKELEMTIESIGEETDGQCVVVFSARRGMSDTATLRMLTAEVRFASYSGLFVPGEAVYFDDSDGPYIFLLTGLQAEKVAVEILCEASDGYVVRDGAENGTVLREGSEIIVEGENIYDGKVVET